MKNDLDKIKEIYGESSIYELQENIEELISNMKYLSSLGFTDIYDIVSTHPYMFLIDEDEFQNKVNILIKELGVEYIEKLEEDTSLWEKVYE